MQYVDGGNSGTTNNTTNNTASTVTGTVTATGLRVRSGAGTGYEVVGSVKQGDQVTILEQTVVDGITWGKISTGWISLQYVTLN